MSVASAFERNFLFKLLRFVSIISVTICLAIIGYLAFTAYKSGHVEIQPIDMQKTFYPINESEKQNTPTRKLVFKPELKDLLTPSDDSSESQNVASVIANRFNAFARKNDMTMDQQQVMADELNDALVYARNENKKRKGNMLLDDFLDNYFTAKQIKADEAAESNAAATITRTAATSGLLATGAVLSIMIILLVLLSMERSLAAMSAQNRA